MKKILAVATIGLLTLPITSSAISVRTEHRANSGGVTVSEGGATATGNQSSSVSVQNIVSGTRSHVQVTTVKDGVTLTETEEFQFPGGIVQVITLTPDSQGDRGRTERGDRENGVLQNNVVISSNVGGSGTHVSVSPRSSNHPPSIRNFKLQNQSVKKTSKKIVTSSSIVVATSSADTHGSNSVPYFVPHVPVQGSVDVSALFTRFLDRIYSMFGIA